MGKVLVEKLLRLTEVEKIYMLMRVKKGKEPKERLIDTFNNPVRNFKCFLIDVMQSILLFNLIDQFLNVFIKNHLASLSQKSFQL